MNLVSIRIITADVRNMVAFYEQVTGVAAVQYTEDFAELQTDCATLAIGSARTLQLFGGDEVAKAAQNRTAIMEFLVKDVDETYDRLSGILQPCLVQNRQLCPGATSHFCSAIRMGIWSTSLRLYHRRPLKSLAPKWMRSRYIIMTLLIAKRFYNTQIINK